MHSGALLLAVTLVCGCDTASRGHDTSGIQTLGRWEWHGRLVVQPDSHLTLERMRIDTGGPGPNGDVVLVRYDFNPAAGVGDEYTIALGLELGRARDLRTGATYAIGPTPGRIPVQATITCLCEPLKLDSARGTVALATRGLRQLSGRLDATLYFVEWNDPVRHVTYFLHQRFDAIK
jgi:hypothetical protein